MNPLQDLKPEIKTFLIVAVIVVVLTVGGILLLKVLQPSSPSAQPATQQTPPAAPTPQPQTLDTSGWQTYRNEEFDFEVRYPETKSFPRFGLWSRTR